MSTNILGEDNTSIHDELSIRAVNWLNSRVTASGSRWATELKLRKGWVADAVVFADLQARYKDEVEPKPNELIEKFLYVFESKWTKGDYDKSFSGRIETHKLKPIGNFNYVVTRKNLITVEELPEGWGWLMKSGNGLREMHKPKYNPITDEFRYQVAWQMLWTAYNYRSSIEDWELRNTRLLKPYD